MSNFTILGCVGIPVLFMLIPDIVGWIARCPILQRVRARGESGSCPASPRSLPRPDLLAEGMRAGWEGGGQRRTWR